MAQITADVQVSADVPITATTETVVATLSGVSTPRRTDVKIEGTVQITPGTNTTGLTLRIRRGTDATGVLIGEANLEIVAGAVASAEDHYLKVRDSGVDLFNGTYVLTVQQTAATANGTALQSSMTASWPE
jgi:hypothetical protein